ncbi:MAG TPA: twin-arginine translocase TatA/TatE family subunit [Candidatus Elarobacter sp.]|nr:twin-arginine translocase TatA/TatE family subunit [Dongiaceae bacterium]HZW53544.1 twin-arginine translocase TatA/TatE family subunit [Candidatus Elarobacter sp.]
MLSIPEMAALGVAALMLFGPEQLPRVARRAGNVMREIQNTSHSFIREMERAADIQDAADVKPHEPPAYDPAPYDAAAYDDSPTVVMSAIEPPAPDPEPADTVSEKLAEPRPAVDPRALRLIYGEPPSRPDPAVNGVASHGSAAAEPAPQREDPPHL